jgi:hypothetical protein
MDSLKINTGTKRILINDGPEFLEFNPSDLSFAERFYGLIGEFENKMVEYQERSKTIDANTELDTHGIPINLADRLGLMRDACEFIRERIDHLFGVGTSQKVFGNALNLDMFMQFFQGITPYIQSARAEKLVKYQKRPHSKRVMS